MIEATKKKKKEWTAVLDDLSKQTDKLLLVNSTILFEILNG